MDFMDFKDKIWQPYLEAILELKEKKKEVQAMLELNDYLASAGHYYPSGYEIEVLADNIDIILTNQIKALELNLAELKKNNRFAYYYRIVKMEEVITSELRCINKELKGLNVHEKVTEHDESQI